MFELDIEMLKEQGLQLVDSAKKTAQDLAGKGKKIEFPEMAALARGARCEGIL